MTTLDYTPYKLSDWFPPDSIEWGPLSYNPKAIKMLETNIDKINLEKLCQNTQGILLIEHFLIESNNQRRKFTHRKKKTLWRILSKNPNAIDLIESNLDKINWKALSSNSNAIHILKKNSSKIHWKMFSSNTNIHQAISLVEENMELLDWEELSANPGAISVIEKNLDKINWTSLSRNENAIHIIEKNLDKIAWYYLALNKNATDILERNMSIINQLDIRHTGKVFWANLSHNPNAMRIIEKNLDKVSWDNLAENSNSISLLKILIKNENVDDFWVYHANYNPNIFEIDYENLDKRISIYKEELIQKCFHPKRLMYYLETYNYNLGDAFYLDIH